MRLSLKIGSFALALTALGLISGLLVTLVAYFYLAPTLPDVETFRDVKLQVPLRIFTRDGRLIAEFGDKRRIPIRYEELPPTLVEAFISAEDDRYFVHPGVDYQGLLRAAIKVITSGGRRAQGGSTITMQLARNIFLIPDKTYKRKVQEIFLALKMEREFSKQEILALYLNKIFLGQRAYGVGAAAEVYFGKTLGQLTLGETAIIAGLPRSPSLHNPVRNPDKAKARRAYVLRRMLELGYIDQTSHDAAKEEPVVATLHGPTVAVHAPYVAEMVRAEVEKRYGREAINEGYRVITTLDSRLQDAAVDAVRHGLDQYDRRHGYRGALDTIENIDALTAEELSGRLADYPRIAKLVPAAVVSVAEDAATLMDDDGASIPLDLESVGWAKRYISDDIVGDEVKSVAEVLTPGDVVYVSLSGERWQLAQHPAVQGALVAVDPLDGAVVALSGGYDFFQSKFNRVVQAKRQPGSVFKPFVYSAALEYGLTPATIINDAPLVFEDWRPKNYEGGFLGETRLREALVRSRNLVSVRVLNEIGIPFAIDHILNFGFDKEELPHDLSLALGSAAVTPLDLATAYAIFANGGYALESYYIDRIENAAGEADYSATPSVACRDCVEIDEVEVEFEDLSCERTVEWVSDRPAPRVLSEQNAYLMTSMMRDVVTRGTGAKARALGRVDLAGKTGTTNDHRDAWFSGFNESVVATTWVGFDKEQPLGRGEAGASTALPGWMHFMASALAGVEQTVADAPQGLVTVRISPRSGLLASAGSVDAIFETFRQDNVPTGAALDYGAEDDKELFDEEELF